MVSEQNAVLTQMRAELLGAPEAVLQKPRCAACGDTGSVSREDERGNRFVRRCACQMPSAAVRMARMGVPARNVECTIDSLSAEGRSRSIAAAKLMARAFVDEYPVGTAGRGLLLCGPCGTGKTHLATGILRELVLRRGASGRFCDFRDLFARLKRTYGSDAREEERDVLAEVLSADVVVLDDLGAGRVTEWSFDIAQTVINELYERQRTVVITTNLANLPQGAALEGPRLAMREETLGDRIGTRAYSRLQEMCRELTMEGDDFRLRRAG